MIETLLVPMERVKVLTKDVQDKLVKETGIRIDIQGNNITLNGEGLQMLAAKNFIQAIGRGFSPQRAWKVLDENQMLEIIELGKFTEKKQREIKSRIIGSKGKMRENIEQKTGALISVYGKTVSIIGNWQEIRKARKAIEMLIKGADISTVNRWMRGRSNER